MCVRVCVCNLRLQLSIQCAALPSTQSLAERDLQDKNTDRDRVHLRSIPNPSSFAMSSSLPAVGALARPVRCCIGRLKFDISSVLRVWRRVRGNLYYFVVLLTPLSGVTRLTYDQQTAKTARERERGGREVERKREEEGEKDRKEREEPRQSE